MPLLARAMYVLGRPSSGDHLPRHRWHRPWPSRADLDAITLGGRDATDLFWFRVLDRWRWKRR